MVRIDGWEVNRTETREDHIPNFARKRDLVERYRDPAGPLDMLVGLNEGAFGSFGVWLEETPGPFGKTESTERTGDAHYKANHETGKHFWEAGPVYCLSIKPLSCTCSLY